MPNVVNVPAQVDVYDAHLVLHDRLRHSVDRFMSRRLGISRRVESAPYVVKARDGSTLRLTLAANAGVAASVKAALSDI